MPPWREQLRPGSFRGVAFQVPSHEGEGFGRRAEVHEYPKRDDAFVEDLGAQTKRFSFEAYIIGPDYFPARDALLNACGQLGPGTLVHPYLGTHEVVCTECRPRESTRNGGMVTFRLRFTATGANRFPAERPDTGQLVQDAAASSEKTLVEVFEELFSTAAGPQWLVDEAQALVEDLAQTLRGVAREIAGQAGDDRAAFARDVDVLEASAAALVVDATQLSAPLLARVQDLGALSTESLSGIGALETLAGWGDGVAAPAETTPTRRQQAQNQDGLFRLVRQTAAIQAAKRATEVTLTSYGDAVALRDRMTALLEAEILVAGDGGSDDAVRALTELLAEVVRDLTARGGQLARVQTFTPAGTMPAALLAYRLYEDASRADEIAARNGIRHPGFLPGGEPLEVLSA